MKFATPLDLYRYSGDGIGFGSLDFSVGGNPYFSIDGGTTNLAGFSTGEAIDLGGDGYQASHWKHQDNPLGIMNPALKPGQVNKISDLDVTAMDVIGWNVQEQVNLDWDEIHQTALEKADSVAIGDHTKDIEKMLKESEEYEGRRSRSSGSVGNSWQVGLWAKIKFQKLDLSDVDFVSKSSEFDSEFDSSGDSNREIPIAEIDNGSPEVQSASLAHSRSRFARGEEWGDKLQNLDFQPDQLARRSLFKKGRRMATRDRQQEDLWPSRDFVPSHLKLPNLEQPLL